MSKPKGTIFQIFIEYFMVPLVITLVVFILLLPGVQKYCAEKIPNFWARVITILFIVFFLSYVINRISFKFRERYDLSGVPKDYW
jgi:predicted PurR-regulated permease PerM